MSPAPSPRAGHGRALLPLAVAACFLGSFLLFAFEPYVGKLLLPSFGGTPLLWNTCMVFFQVALLAGYLYALLLSRMLTSRQQVLLHLAALATLFFAYPNSVSGLSNATDSPLASLVGWLSGHALLPFLGLAALTTLVQAWFSRSRHPGAGDPWRLYAASNAGSMGGLFAYPLLVEPHLDLGAQRDAFLAVLALLVVVLAWLGTSLDGDDSASAPDAATASKAEPLAWGRILGLTAVPASLLLSVTNYVLTDIASIPFFWTIPLALYLLTFILAFGRRLDPLPELFGRLGSLLLLVVVATLAAEANSPARLLIPLHLLVFFLCCLACHVRVTTLQPATSRLAHYYLAISLGGAIGGTATLLLPPLFTDGFLEYPVALVLAAVVLVPGVAPSRTTLARAADVLVPAALLLGGTRIAATIFPGNAWGPAMPWLPAAFYVLSANTRGTVFATRLAAALAASLLVPSPFGHTVFAERNFFGRVRVTVDGAGEFHQLVHGSTIHGMQSIAGMKGCHPVSYYHPTGPAGRYLSSQPEAAEPRRVALVGLGSGALACYARPGEHWDLYEINPAMAAVATDPRLFTFVTNSPASSHDIVLGDARLAMERKTDVRYDLIVVDAFSSDAIPLHLLTREALATWTAHLTPHGVLLFHISNRFFRLKNVLADSGATASLEARIFADLAVDEASAREGKAASTWMILARPPEAGALSSDWKAVPADDGRVWTDEFSNPLGTLDWSAVN